MVPRPPNAVRPCCWQAGWLASNDEERPERVGRETRGVGKSPLDADWALHLSSFPPAYNGLNKNRAISILACSDGLYVCTPRTLCTSGSMYTLHRTNRDFFLSIGGCCTLHQNFGCYFFSFWQPRSSCLSLNLALDCSSCRLFCWCFSAA